MSAGLKPVIRCAIYTRKSSEEGLDQSFNSLDAQREACEAFIASQREEGWRVLTSRYDDGGYSGGNMDRPGLARLLRDIDANEVDCIVVYKVDRLTRSLADFAKIVESFDAHGVSFVSVTQQFNTTSSMGRLTLNVLLSFAQFEREVTGERIRDKIAASKRKGMWMGGAVPLGYDSKERKLRVNAREAKIVLQIFQLYLELGCVSKLKAHLDQKGIKSKVRVSVTNKQSGGGSYSRGALYEILQNPIYLGEIRHRAQRYPGEHEAIIPKELWDQVQGKLRNDNQGRRYGLQAKTPSLLASLLEDSEGNRFSPSHTTKNGKRYRYYVARNGSGQREANKYLRLPAYEIEQQVLRCLHTFLQSPNDIREKLGGLDESLPFAGQLLEGRKKCLREWSANPAFSSELVRTVVRRIIIHPGKIELKVSKRALRALLTRKPEDFSQAREPETPNDKESLVCLGVEVRMTRCGEEMRLVIAPDGSAQAPTDPNPSLVKALARGRQWYKWLLSGEVSTKNAIAQKVRVSERYVGRVLECAFLAPDIVETILQGQQPPDLTFEKLTRGLPSDWGEQRSRLGFAPSRRADLHKLSHAG